MAEPTILDRIVERRRVDVRDAAAVVPRAALSAARLLLRAPLRSQAG
ncbi:MAG: hypothetical protein R3B97_15210 [Dehalococcoidia bacterium]